MNKKNPVRNRRGFSMKSGRSAGELLQKNVSGRILNKIVLTINHFFQQGIEE